MNALKYIATTIALIFVWLATATYGAINGWWVKAIASADEPQQFVAAIEAKAQHTLTTQSPGNLAWVLIEDGQVYHRSFAHSVDDINEHTLFPAASMSKLITAYAVLRMLEEFNIDLDHPIGPHLTRWQLPASEYNQRVTLRQLLSHTAGLTDGLGFGDYQPNDALPSLEQSLAKPLAANGNAVIAVTEPPGQQWKYSGGGYLLLELLIEEITGMSFEQWVKKSVLEPLAMNRSTYAYLGHLGNISKSYDGQGQEATLYQYASSAATGFNTSTTDLTKLAQALLSSQNKHIAEQLRQPTGFKAGAAIWGLGAMLYVPTKQGDFIFGHDGSNDPAINSTIRVNPTNNDAIIVLSTGPKYLASDIGYEWALWQTGVPDFLNFDKALNSAALPGLIGSIGIIGLVLIVVYRPIRGPRLSEPKVT